MELSIIYLIQRVVFYVPPHLSPFHLDSRKHAMPPRIQHRVLPLPDLLSPSLTSPPTTSSSPPPSPLATSHAHTPPSPPLTDTHTHTHTHTHTQTDRQTERHSSSLHPLIVPSPSTPPLPPPLLPQLPLHRAHRAHQHPAQSLLLPLQAQPVRLPATLHHRPILRMLLFPRPHRFLLHFYRSVRPRSLSASEA
jgi:hypothetical protein